MIGVKISKLIESELGRPVTILTPEELTKVVDEVTKIVENTAGEEISVPLKLRTILEEIGIYVGGKVPKDFLNKIKDDLMKIPRIRDILISNR